MKLVGKPNEASIFCTGRENKMKTEVLNRLYRDWQIIGFFERRIPESLNPIDREYCMVTVRININKDPWKPRETPLE